MAGVADSKGFARFFPACALQRATVSTAKHPGLSF